MAYPTPADLPITVPEAAAGARAGLPVPPRTPYEEAIAGIWRDALDRADIGVFDDFFDLGGHSLLALRVIARIRRTLGADVPVQSFFEGPTVAELASTVSVRMSVAPRVIAPRPPDADPVLSYDQQRLWLEDQLLPAAAYNVHGRRRVVGPIDVAALERSIRAVLTRHETLRTRFPTGDGRPIQVVDDPEPGWRLRVEDLSGLGGDRAAAAERLMDEQALTPFDLATGPLARFLLIRTGDAEHLLTVTMHHIVSDDWSVGVLVRELSALYEVGGDVARAGLTPLPVQYRDYAVWQRTTLVDDELSRNVDHWRRHLAGAPPALTLPITRRDPDPAGVGARLHTMLSGPDTADLHRLCRERGVTPFMALLGVWATLLARWSGQPEVVVGVPIAGRTVAGNEDLIGFFVNTLPLRVSLTGNPTFVELLEHTRGVALDGYAHADAPFDVVIEHLQPARNPRRTPVFQVLLNALDTPAAERIGGVSLESIPTPALPSKFELILTTQPLGDALRIELTYDTGRFERSMMLTLLDQLTVLLRAVIVEPTRGVLDQPLTTAGAADSRATANPAPPWLAGAVAAHAASSTRPAVVASDGQRDYPWLAAVGDRVARRLAGLPGLDREHLGVVRRPTAAFVAAVLGCVRAGVPYTIVEPDSHVPARFLGVTTIVDVGPTGPVDGTTLDLRAETSGPGGEPMRPVPGAGPEPGDDWAVERFGLGPDDRFAAVSTAPGQLLHALASAMRAGGAVLLPDDAVTGDIDALGHWLRETAPTIVHLAPVTLRALAGGPRPVELPAVRHAFVENAGELIAADVVALHRLAPHARLVGLYRVDRDGRPAAVHAVRDGWDPRTAPLRVPLGTEPGARRIRLLDRSGQAAATGEVAEVCIGGHPTGDLARRLPDGTLEFAGRLGADPAADPVETLAALFDLPAVQDAVVLEQATADGDTRLIGYVTGPEAVAAAVRQHLRRQLPPNLVPEHIIVLETLPLTRCGERDLEALPAPTGASGPDDRYVAPRTPVEHELVATLVDLLGLDRIGVHDSFFELGGYSLLATQLTTRIRETFQVELTLRAVFGSPTVETLAQLIVTAQAERADVDDLEAILDEVGRS